MRRGKALLVVCMLALLDLGCATLGSGFAHRVGDSPELSPRVMTLFIEAQLALEEPLLSPADDRVSRAAALLEQAIALEPNSPLLHRYLAEAWASQPDFERSIRAATEAVRLDPTDASAQLLLGDQLRRVGKLELAVGHLREAARRGVGAPHPELPHQALHEVLVQLGRAEEAVAALDAWIAALPHDARAPSIKARYLWDLGRADEARTAALAALEVRSDDESSAEILAQYYRFDRPSEAALLEKLVEQNWSSRSLHRRLVVVYDGMGRYDLALSHLRYVGMLDARGGEELRRRRARLLTSMHRHTEARELVEESLVLVAEPHAPDDLLLLGDILSKAGEPGEALTVLRRVEPGEPWYWMFALRRAELHLEQGDAELASETVFAARQFIDRSLVDADAQLLAVAVRAELAQQDFSAAVGFLEELAVIDEARAWDLSLAVSRGRGTLDLVIEPLQERVAGQTSSTWDRIQLAQLLAEVGRGTEAVETIDAGIELTRKQVELRLRTASPPQSYLLREEEKAQVARLRLRRSFVEKSLGDSQAAEGSLRTLLEDRPNDADALNALGYLLAEEGRELDEAERLVEQALEQRPYSGAFQDSLGWVFFQQGRFPESVERLELAGRYLPGDGEILEHLGDAYRALGDSQQAVRVYERTLDSLEDGRTEDRIRAQRVSEKLSELHSRAGRAE